MRRETKDFIRYILGVVGVLIFIAGLVQMNDLRSIQTACFKAETYTIE